MESTLKGAFVISVIIHAGIFAPFYNQHILRQELEKNHTVVVDYVVLKEIAAAAAGNKGVIFKTPEAPQIDAQKEVAVKPQPAPQVNADNRKISKSSKLKDRTDSRKRGASDNSAKEALKEDAELKQRRDYIDYYQLIRERIRSRLKDSYRYYNREGDVYLSFTITPNGSLLNYSIDKSRSTQDDILLQITGNSLKAVSPFPALPRSLSMPKMSFSIAISFKK